jgi:hypothetical protein
MAMIMFPFIFMYCIDLKANILKYMNIFTSEEWK